ncbi:MAG: methyltransferase [Bacteroidales bacterium]|nr:methyltransferase [Bacteroidales bacterium]
MDEFISLISKSLEANTFVKVTLSSPLNKDADVRNIYVKQVEIKCERKLSFTYRYQKRDIVKNFAIDEGISNIRKHVGEDFRFATLFTIAGDFVLQRNGNHFKLKRQEASVTELPSLSHDRSKNRKLEASDGKKYLHLLGITDANGNVNPKSQDKFKQITHYIEILSSHIDTLPTDRTITVADMGSGKGYLTLLSTTTSPIRSSARPMSPASKYATTWWNFATSLQRIRASTDYTLPKARLTATTPTSSTCS